MICSSKSDVYPLYWITSKEGIFGVHIKTPSLCFYIKSYNCSLYHSPHSFITSRMGFIFAPISLKE